MNTIVVTSTKQNIKFGYEGEDNVTKIIFPYDESWLEYGEGNFEVRILRCGDEVAYTATDVVDDRQAMTLTMTVTDIELSVRGRGEMQLCYVCPDSIKKSPIYQYTVNRSVDYKYAVDPPEGSIIASVEKSLSEIKNTTNRLSNSVISIESSIDDVNSQIDNINDKISEFDEEIDSIGDVETRVDNLETSLQSINGRINTAEGNINENTESISDLNESVTELENRKVTDLETSGGRSDSGKYLTVGTDGKIKATSLTIPPTITVDASLSTTSTNPVQNKVIKTELNNINSNIATCNTEISKINGSLGDVKADLSDVNAELADARVGANGVTYESAGAAVRGQTKDIKDILGMASVTSISDYQLGSRHGSGNWSYDTTTAITNKLYSFRSGTVISVTDPNYKFLCCDSSGEYNKYYVGWCTTSITFTEDVQVYAELRKTDNSAIDINALDGILVASYTSNSGLIDNVEQLTTTVENLHNAVTMCYVDASSGSDNNDGSNSHPFRTISHAISLGYKNISVSPNTYSEQLSLINMSDVTIKPYNSPTFSPSSYESKIILDGGGLRNFGIFCFHSSNINIEGVEVKNFVTSGFRLNDCSNIRMTDCIVHTDAGKYKYSIGFELINTNASFTNCMAHDVILDGFNMHGYGATELINCVAYNCGDDGVSHHDGCTGVIIGGEYYNCGKGGVASPTYGAYINIYGVYSHGNLYGIYAAKKESDRDCKAVISNCLVVDNTNKDLYIRGIAAIGYNNIYGTKEIGADATFTEYPT